MRLSLLFLYTSAIIPGPSSNADSYGMIFSELEAVRISLGHFIGSIVYVEEGLSNVSLKSPLLVIDGQQRLTTVTLLLAALAEALGDEEPVEGFSKEKILYYYLLNHLERGDRHYKLLLSQTDKSSLLHILGAPAPRGRH